jgi:hypothetical protein
LPKLKHKVATAKLTSVPFVVEFHGNALRGDPGFFPEIIATAGRQASNRNAGAGKALRLQLAASPSKNLHAAEPQKRIEV